MRRERRLVQAIRDELPVQPEQTPGQVLAQLVVELVVMIAVLGAIGWTLFVVAPSVSGAMPWS